VYRNASGEVSVEFLSSTEAYVTFFLDARATLAVLA
jgi:hypothetical protein